MKNFRTYNEALQFYKECQKLKLVNPIKDQLNRASLSICLNLAEGSGRKTPKDQKHFYTMAYASLNETKCLLQITENEVLYQMAHKLGAPLYVLAFR